MKDRTKQLLSLNFLLLCCRSRKYISNHYREFDGLPEEETAADAPVNDEDLLENIVSPKSLDFSYSLSPGYHKW